MSFHQRTFFLAMPGTEPESFCMKKHALYHRTWLPYMEPEPLIHLGPDWLFQLPADLQALLRLQVFTSIQLIMPRIKPGTFGMLSMCSAVSYSLFL